jgi:peptide-methionine (R)-S-oxide reductase
MESAVHDRRQFLIFTLCATACAVAGTPGDAAEPSAHVGPGFALDRDPATVTRLTKTEAEWKAALSPFAYQVLREQGTERAFTGRYWDHHEKGTYCCAGCGLGLFASADKFDSGTGWPSYTRPVAPGRVEDRRDTKYGIVRTEVVCARCLGHLGHVFEDGPPPTGLRYCR